MCKTAVGVMGEHWSQTFSEILGTAFFLKRHKKDQILHRALGQWVLKSQVFSTLFKPHGLAYSFTEDFSITWFYLYIIKQSSWWKTFMCSFIHSLKCFKCLCLPSDTKTLKNLPSREGDRHINISFHVTDDLEEE